MKKMFSKDRREAVYGALVMVAALMCAGCSQGRLHEVSDGETRGSGDKQEGQTGVTVHVDTAWQDTIRIKV